jgi:hypothetical protein
MVKNQEKTDNNRRKGPEKREKTGQKATMKAKTVGGNSMKTVKM